jgi:hypothetical protein
MNEKISGDQIEHLVIPADDDEEKVEAEEVQRV